MITSSAVTAAYTQAFLDAFASLGIEPWAGIEMDVAWGQTTLRFGLHRPSVTGPIFVYRVCTSLRQVSHADLSPAWRIIPVSKWLLTIVSKSPK